MKRSKKETSEIQKCTTCISGSIASPNEKAIVPRALKALNILKEDVPSNL